MNEIPNMEIPNDLVEQVSNRKCVLFIGAGVSRAAGLPGWRDLLLNLLKYCDNSNIKVEDLSDIQKKIDDKLYPEAAEMIIDCMNRDDPIQFHRFIKDEINKKNAKPTLVHKIITQLPIEVILTTNYDKLIERAYSDYKGFEPDNFSLSDQFTLVQNRIQTAKGFVLHVHGSIDVPDKIIIKKRDYNELMRCEGCNSIYQQLISSNTILFIGFGLEDPNFLHQMDKLKQIFGTSNCNHYAFMSSKNAQKWRNRDESSLDKFSIISYPEENRTECVLKFLKNLQNSVEMFEANEKNSKINYKKEWNPDKLNTNYGDSRFYSIGRFEPKTPMELLKEYEDEYEGGEEILKRNKLLKYINDISKEKYFKDKIERFRIYNFADLYSNSWLDRELQIIGLHMLYKLFKNSREEMEREDFKLNVMYDVGCSNWSQYIALQAFLVWNKIPVDNNFRYHAQDINPQWRNYLPKKDCEFIQKNLPDFDESFENECDLVCCTHTLHYLGKNPLAIYSSFFSFNRLLKLDRYCYVTVPDKNILPGMPDLLDKAARDSGFIIKDKGKKRLVHRLDKDPNNITTFYYLILKKVLNVPKQKSNNLIGSSLLRGKDYECAANYGITKEQKIRKEISDLETSFKNIISTENIYVRIFTYALEIVLQEKKIKRENEYKEEENENKYTKQSNKEIEDYVRRIQCLIMSLGKSRVNSLERRCKLQETCSEYFKWLLICLIQNDNKDLLMTKEAIKFLSSPAKDIRVDENELNGQKIARLAKHLIEVCLYEKIDILNKLESTFIDCED